MRIVDGKSIEVWIVCIAGFGSHEGRSDGVERLQDRLHRKFSNETTRVLLRNWNDSATYLAHRIDNWKDKKRPPIIILIGHSYGGFACTEIAAELQKVGLLVDLMFLIDAVWRPGVRASLLSLLAWWKIMIPANVKKAFAWRQNISKPAGQELVLLSKETELQETSKMQVPHTKMDDLQGIWDVVEKEITYIKEANHEKRRWRFGCEGVEI